MNNYQLDNTSVYLGGQCKWDIILGRNESGSLCITDFRLSPLSPVVPFNVDVTKYLLNNNHGYNLKTFYESIKGYFWDTNYDTNNSSCYDISRYAGCHRRKTYNEYHKQFEYFQPIWLEDVNEISEEDVSISPLKFVFKCYSVVDGERKTLIDDASIEFSDSDNSGEFHKKFIQYFNDWLKVVGVAGITKESDDTTIIGNDKVAYVSFEDNKVYINGVSVSSGVPSGTIDLSYMIQNFLMYERPLIETDEMITRLFKDYNLVTSQLFNFNFCFNINDLFDPQICKLINGKSVIIDCDVFLGENQLIRKSIFTNYEWIDKTISNPFTMYGGTEWDGDELIENYDWDPSDSTDYHLINGDISLNVLDYLKDYEYPGFQSLNKLTQDIVHWGYTMDDSRTFNLYNGFRGLIQYPSVDSYGKPQKKGDNYLYDLVYDDGSNGISVSTAVDSYKPYTNCLSWICPFTILYIDTNNISNLLYYPNEYINKYGVTLNDIANTWNVELSEDEDIPSEKILFIYTTTGISDIESLGSPYGEPIYDDGGRVIGGVEISDEFIIIYTNNLDFFTLGKWIYGRDGYDNSDNSKPLLDIMSTICDIIYIGNESIPMRFGTEIDYTIDSNGNLQYMKSSNHVSFPRRHSGAISPFMIDHEKNFIYTGDLACDCIIKMDGYENYPIEYQWNGYGCIKLLYPHLEYTVELDPNVSWHDNVKNYLGELYNVTTDDDKNYIFNLYNCDMNFVHLFEGNEEKVKYTIKMNLI